jgi:hypothetical protein
MSDEESFIVKYRDLATIVRTQDATALEEFLDQPLQAIAETITGVLASGNSRALYPIAGRLVQGALKGKLFQQVSREINKLRETGRIDSNFAEEKTGYQSWVELMSIIDSELPDEDKLEALKAMFFSVNKVNAKDADKIIAYQLFQIAKRLNSAELMVLKATFETYRDQSFGPESRRIYSIWESKVAEKLGSPLLGLVQLGEEALIKNGLLTPRLADPNLIETRNARLTDLGIKFCHNIHEYQLEIGKMAS